VLLLFTIIEVGAEQCLFSIAKDVTDTKREAEEQRRSAERLRLLAENAQDIIFRYRYTDPLGWEYISPAVTRIGGYTPEEFYTDPDQASKIVHPEDREAFDRMEEELQSGPVELRWVRKDGSIIWTEQRNTPVYDQGGNLVAMEGIVRDITERKRAEASFHEAREQLEAKAERHVRPANSYDLTFREVTVLHLIADGKADKEIASTLGISALTASKHVANILMKMQAASRTEAGVRAVREELII
jgi:PAS domain S-box-containing protein